MTVESELEKDGSMNAGVDPVSDIRWISARFLRPNSWNPNMVYDLELQLLERSMLVTGWVFPILVSRSRLIVDGYHRWRLAQDSAALVKKYGGRVPIATLDCADDEAMVTTIRMNRAHGEHGAVRMSALVRALVDDHHWERERIAAAIGAAPGEIDLLYDASIFKRRSLQDWKYSEAWEPADR